MIIDPRHAVESRHTVLSLDPTSLTHKFSQRYGTLMLWRRLVRIRAHVSESHKSTHPTMTTVTPKALFFEYHTQVYTMAFPTGSMTDTLNRIEGEWKVLKATDPHGEMGRWTWGAHAYALCDTVKRAVDMMVSDGHILGVSLAAQALQG